MPTPVRIDVITLFPRMFTGPFEESIIKRAIDAGLVEIVLHNLRDWGIGKHRTVDDCPHGGGPGMVLMCEPLFAAVEAVKGEAEVPVVLLSPQGRLFTQKVAREFAAYDRMILICGHYEGVDERVCEHLVTDEISIGDYVLTGGELPAMVVIDAVVRLIPGVLGAKESAFEDSHTGGLLEYPQYTRPASFRGWEVPEVLLSGHHAEIARWRRRQSIIRTFKRRPDLLAKADLTAEEREFVSKLTEGGML